MRGDAERVPIAPHRAVEGADPHLVGFGDGSGGNADMAEIGGQYIDANAGLLRRTIDREVGAVCRRSAVPELVLNDLVTSILVGCSKQRLRRHNLVVHQAEVRRPRDNGRVINRGIDVEIRPVAPVLAVEDAYVQQIRTRTALERQRTEIADREIKGRAFLQRLSVQDEVTAGVDKRVIVRGAASASRRV